MCAGAHICVYASLRSALNYTHIDRCRIEDHNFATSIAVAIAGNILALRAKIVILVAMSTDFVPKFNTERSETSRASV